MELVEFEKAADTIGLLAKGLVLSGMQVRDHARGVVESELGAMGACPQTVRSPMSPNTSRTSLSLSLAVSRGWCHSRHANPVVNPSSH